MTTIREIAKRVGFSQATVSRVLKDDPTFSVKDSTREKILNASLEMGYKNVPQYQRITIPQDVAILDNAVPDEGLQDAYFDELREVLVKHAEEQLMNVTMQKDVDSLIANADKYAGFISIGPSPLDRKTLHRLHKKLPHGVFIDINPAPALFDSVQPDLEQTILDAIDALMASGCSRIGFIGGLGLLLMLLAIAFWRNGIVKLMTWAFKLAGKMHIVKDPEKRIVDTTKTIDDAYNEMRYMMKKPRLFARSIAVTFVQLLEFFAISYVIMRGLGCDGDFLTVISCQAFVYMISSFVPTPGAMGAAETSYALFFSTIYPSASFVALSTFIWRFLTFYFPIVTGMLVTLAVNRGDAVRAQEANKNLE